MADSGREEVVVFEGMPQRGVVFWPVGTGDSTTVVITDEIVMQVDLHDMAKADSDDSPEFAVVDRLAEVLPVVNGRPYLAVFVLTHADQDHCRGFADLLDKVHIGELWATPRLWREFDDEDTVICDDARAFQEETERRVAAIKKAVADGQPVQTGDRVLVIGYDTDHDKHAYDELPDEYLAYPGQAVSRLDGVDVAGTFEVFLHAPFKDDCAAPRNETSVAMQVTLIDNDVTGKILLFGDLAHDTIMKIFTFSEDNNRSERLAWNVLLAPHHCSKKVMYIVEDGKDVLAQDVLDAFEKHALDGAIVVSSSCPVPASNKPGENPPHALAKARYSEIADDFICTMEHPDTICPQPIVFGLATDGFVLVDPVDVEESKSAVVEASRSGKRLALVAGAAAVAGAALAHQMRHNTVASANGPSQVREAIAQASGNQSAPTQVTGFGGW